MKKLFGIAALLLPTLTLAGAPPVGVPLQVRRGVYAETETGMFFTVGGSRGVSNAQPFLGAGIGYDILPKLSIGAHFDVGASSGNCFTPEEVADTGECLDPNYLDGSGVQIPLAANFAVFGMSLQARYGFEVAERVRLSPKVILGMAKLTPQPVAPASGNPDDAESFNAMFGFGGGIEYATNLDHFSIGLDVEMRQVVGPNITAVAFFPRIKYTF